MLLAAHVDESRHVMGGEADKVQIAFAPAQGELPELQVHVANARGAVRHVGRQVFADAFQVFHFFLLLLGRDVLGFKVNQFHQGAADVQAEPGKDWREKTKRR